MHALAEDTHLSALGKTTLQVYLHNNRLFEVVHAVRLPLDELLKFIVNHLEVKWFSFINII